MRKFFLSTAALCLITACGDNTQQTKAPVEIPKFEKFMSGGVYKSAKDNRDYAFRQLDNGLKIIVVSDPDADKAAASLDVHIGHMADPADREGLTHFLEHMLFLGTEKYPEVGEYQKFISKHGGSNNAGTGQEHTSYYFQIDNVQLEPALDRFSRFFIDPLFDPEYVEKERNAVESEYSLKVKEDARRYREAVKQTANQAHPATQFSVGNLTTLSDTDSSTILEDVKAHYDKYYSSDIMTLAVLGNYSTDQLMDWAVSKFSDVPSKGDRRNMDRPEPFLEDQKGVKIMINTLEEKRTLSLNFALPPRTEHYSAKPVSFISGLLGHEGEGTLYNVLKKKNYLKSLSSFTWGPDDHTLLRVYFELTDEGYENIDEITDYFFSYVEKIRREGVDKSMYVEKASLADQSFEYRVKSRVSSYVGGITHNLQYYPPEYALDIGRVYEDFNPELIRSFLTYINPEDVRMVISTPDFDSEQKEERYDVAYGVEPLDPQKIENWKSFKAIDKIALPKPNPFIAEDLSAINANAITRPEKVVDKPGLEFWYVNENEFDLPKSNLSLSIFPKLGYQSPEHMMAQSLHRKIVWDLLDSESYPASQAGLFVGVSGGADQYSIGVQGFNDKIDLFLQTVLDKFDPEQVSEDVFQRVKKNQIQEISNEAFSRPISQIFSEFSTEINKNGLDNEERLAVLNSMDLAEFKTLISEILSEVEISAIYNGNVSKKAALDISKIVEREFEGRLKAGVRQHMRQIELPESDVDLIRQYEIDHADSTIVWAFQSDDTSIETRAKGRLLQQIMRPRFYKSLRTDQQYGYVVGMFNSAPDQRTYTGFYIQSPKAHPSVLKSKIREFLVGEIEYLSNMTKEDFAGQVEGLLSNINKKYDNVYVKGNSLSSELYNENYEFDTREDLTAAVKALSVDDILEYLQTELLSAERRSFVIWNIGNAHKDLEDYDPARHDLCQTKHCITSRFD